MQAETAAPLARRLKNRHIQMIALGGAIGTGLFYGSAASIQLVGPSVILSYVIGGAVIYLIMRMLGEMSVQEPVAGAFSHFAFKYCGPFAGFVSGWNYWLLYVLVSMAELTVVGIYVGYWFPDIPGWATALTVLVAITAINLINVRFFGEAEFWFALVKVAAVIGMIVLGLVLIVFGLGGPATGVGNLWQHGGFLPHGMTGLVLSLAVVMFSFGGTELIGITAGEAEEPRKSIPRAIRQVMWRILIFYVGSLTVLLVIFPWSRVGMDGSPFVTIFSQLGIPAAAHILNFVVLTAAISVYNSAIYSNGRMLYSLAEQGNAPRIFKTVSANKIPYVAILFSSSCTLAAVILNYLIPGSAFMQIMAVATAAAALTWVLIIVVHLRFRRQRETARAPSFFPALFHPAANYLCIGFMVLLLGVMSQLEDMKSAVYVLPIWLAVLAVSYGCKMGFRSQRAS
ncbi:Aromatic amino acid transport protein AroP [plant metagenome]|uniref:Aromatic amino acid transport protein AroP n=1 Tax=plant metagenome TaxID=1297885 RepID=A0A484SX18_9ZZZZ